MAHNEPQRTETPPGPSPNSPSLLFEYQCRSGKFIRLANRIESKLFLPELECSKPLMVRQDPATINSGSPPSCGANFCSDRWLHRYQGMYRIYNLLGWLASKVSRYLSILCLCLLPLFIWRNCGISTVSEFWQYSRYSAILTSLCRTLLFDGLLIALKCRNSTRKTGSWQRGQWLNSTGGALTALYPCESHCHCLASRNNINTVIYRVCHSHFVSVVL